MLDNYAYNSITCLEDTELPLNDQIINGIGIKANHLGICNHDPFALLMSDVAVFIKTQAANLIGLSQHVVILFGLFYNAVAYMDLATYSDTQPF